MTDDNNTTAGLDQADEDILSYTVSDEALEAAAGTEGYLTLYTTPIILSLLAADRPAASAANEVEHRSP
jgi:hypothetical protein